jgi:hypothetical protein
MRFSSIYESVIFLWGDEIDITDYNVENVTTNELDSTRRRWQAKSSKNLSERWNTVEKEIGLDNPYNDLMVWTMYQVFHSVSERLYIQNKFKLHPPEVDKKLIEEQYYKNLKVAGWEHELKEYVNDIT